MSHNKNESTISSLFIAALTNLLGFYKGMQCEKNTPETSDPCVLLNSFIIYKGNSGIKLIKCNRNSENYLKRK